MKHLTHLALAALFLAMAACAGQQPPPTAAPPTAAPATSAPPATAAPPTAGPSSGKCGDGIWDAAEQADPNLCPQDAPTAAPSAPTATGSAAAASELTFIPDPGVRVDNASNPNVGIDPAGRVYLYYLDRAANREAFAVASDDTNLDFSQGTPVVKGLYPYDSRNTLLPDGTWRRYGFDLRTAQLTSLSSTDGTNFTQDDGVRYTLHENDNGEMGVYDIFADPSGGVVMIYLGDLHGLNNLRRAYSTDGGWTFVFERGDVLGDSAAGGGPNSYVDPFTFLLPDGRRRLITMKQGSIYTFISDANFTTFTLEPDVRIAPSDFTEFKLMAFFDPKVVRLPDGRHRVFVAAAVDDGTQDHQVIVSATTR